ncbi:MAG: hypothetical protein E7414_01685 [Ruminococcaceae bacterium]|nr:hypothetical protein [Oscillospiraceae bacterium]
MKIVITAFYSGGMGNFDKMCEKAVKALGGHLTFVPYNVKQVKAKDTRWFDDILCPFGDKAYGKYDIPNRSRWLVNHCDVFLCHVYKSGGARHTLNYAVQKNKQIIHIAP